MSQDLSPQPLEITIEKPRPMGPGRVAIAGVFGACALGAGLGLWARPAPPEPPGVAERAEPPRPALQVVVDDTLPPANAPLEVLPADLSPTPKSGLPRLIPVEPQAPRHPAAGLVKVDAVVAAPTPTAPVHVMPVEKLQEIVASAPAKPVVAKVEKAVERSAKVEKAVARPEPKPAATKAKVAATKPAKKPEKLARVERVEKLKAEKPRVAKVEKAKPVKLAKVEPKKKPVVKAADAKPAKAATLAKSAKVAPKKAVVKAKAPAVKKKDVRVAEAKPKVVKAKVAKPAPARKPKVEKPRVETAKVRRPTPAPRLVIPRGEGPMRVAKAAPCAQADPGEAIVCADRRLAVRDRQLQQAYRNAEAAGVPSSALRRQQDRWVQARAAAARDAPWAVEDVYVARISELNDLSRDAREN
ncbi:MAG TPA: hypothetical protein VGD44_10475 [Phenylobacterium sp.]